MNDRNQQIDRFFNTYADRFNKAINGETPDIEGTANSFSRCFIEASPMVIDCGKNDEQFRAAIPQGYTFYKSIGVTSMDILSKEITILDNLHAMTKVHWKSTFIKKDKSKGNIKFDIIYFLQTKENESKIFAYITGDEQAALKENGLI